MSNKEQTAVEWLYEQLTLTWYDYNSGKDLLDKSKAMHKEEIIDSFGVGCQVEASRLIGYHKMAEQYYKKAFNNE